MKIFQTVAYPIIVFLVIVGCKTLYDRESSMIQNQAVIANEILEMKKQREEDVGLINQFLNQSDLRLKNIENKKK